MKSNISTRVFSEVPLDFKYRMITQSLPIEYISVKYYEFIKFLISNIFNDVNREQKTFFHIRYIKWRGYLRTIPTYLLIIWICKLKNVSITWTCHNIWEYKFKSKLQNKILRNFIYKVSERIVVLHKDIIEYLPKESRGKVVIANFGDFTQAVRSNNKVNKDFMEQYDSWTVNGKQPDLVMISTIPDPGKFISLFANLLNYRSLFIVPKYGETVKKNNIFVYNNFVYGEVENILKIPNIIGLVILQNLSVPTSIYMFASFGIPILAYDHSPVNTIVEENELGLTFTMNDDINEKIKEIKSNYDFYKSQMKIFLAKYSWEKSAQVHKEIWC